MDKESKVLVFESDNSAEVQEIIAQMKEKGIEAFFEDSPMAFPYPQDQNSFKIKVKIIDEPKAFEVIDAFMGKED